MNGMSLRDFKAFLRRNATPSAQLAVIMMGQEPFDVATIIDEHKYERMRRNHKRSWGSDADDWVETGHTYQDYMRMSTICNIGYHDGWIPYLGSDGEENETTGDWIKRPFRGIRRAIHILLKEGCLRPTPEVALWGDYMSPLGYINRDEIMGGTCEWARQYATI